MTTIKGSSVSYQEKFEATADINFVSSNWIINSIDTVGVYEESRLQLNEFLVNKCQKYIGPEVLSVSSAESKGIIPPGVDVRSPKMMASLFRYDLQVSAPYKNNWK